MICRAAATRVCSAGDWTSHDEVTCARRDCCCRCCNSFLIFACCTLRGWPDSGCHNQELRIRNRGRGLFRSPVVKRPRRRRPRFREFDQTQHRFARTSGHADLREYCGVDAGEDADRQHRRARASAFADFRHSVNRPAHHFTAAARVNREERDSEFGGRTRGAGDLMGNVVKLQVEKNLRVLRDDVSDDLRTREVNNCEPTLNMPATSRSSRTRSSAFAGVSTSSAI